MATDCKTQLIERGKDFVLWILGVDSSLCITEEILDIKSMHGTTKGKDIFENVCQSVTDMKQPWDKLVGLADGAPAICGEKSGLVGRMRLTC